MQVAHNYKYSVDAKIKGGEEIDLTANVDIFCESGQYTVIIYLIFIFSTLTVPCILTLIYCIVGIFKKEPAIRHCITVRDAVGRISL